MSHLEPQTPRIFIRGVWRDDVAEQLQGKQLHSALSVLDGFTAEVGTLATQVNAERAEILVGLGPRQAASPQGHRRAGMSLARRLVKSLRPDETAHEAMILDVDTQSLLPNESAELGVADYSAQELLSAWSEALVTGSYRFRMLTADTGVSDSLQDEPISPRGAAIGRGVNEARNFVNLPPNALRPAAFAQRLRENLEPLGVKVQVLGDDELRSSGYGGIVAIGKGSPNPPALVELYSGTGEPDIVLVGKGITFDSGGLSMKTPDMMQEMKVDMAGAGAIAGLFTVLHEIAPDKNIAAVLALAENMPGPHAVRPGDVISMRNGKLLEILDTDFEGRVVLADALARASELQPKTIIDLATLTYAAVHALGEQTAALVSNDDQLAQSLEVAGQVSGDNLWRMPILPELDEQLRSNIADYKNHPGAATARTSSAAGLLQKFVGPDIAWAHLDMFGPAWKHAADSRHPAGATGFGVRLLAQFLQET